MKNLKPALLLATTIIFILFSRCSDDNVNLTSQVKIRLTDAPAQYDQVNIDIQSIQINSSDNDSIEDGWVEMTLLNPGIYDLLEFNNGMDTLLVDQEMPSGTVSQMRLILGENNSVVIDSISYDLDTPSAQTSGLKFQIHDDFLAGIEYNLWIDFDAANSIVETGNGKYKLKPVIRTFKEANTGSISGIISPAEATPSIHAIMGTDTISTIAEDSGNFLLKGLEEGSYTLSIIPIDGYLSTEIESVEVYIEKVSDVGTIELSEE
ncbi:DUF4382 domain-containing protein [Labilibaculum sp.]|uniref:DUF4382 domain-containing protein n=1 Tax=Labilibaculum sp. TaxID=2060723 RepID=UPI003568FB27